jgi:hypothetical protein
MRALSGIEIQYPNERRVSFVVSPSKRFIAFRDASAEGQGITNVESSDSSEKRSTACCFASAGGKRIRPVYLVKEYIATQLADALEGRHATVFRKKCFQ